MDIPFIRFAFPVLILYGFWYWLVANPWSNPEEDVVHDANYLSQEAAQDLLGKSRDLFAQGKYEEAVSPLHRLRQAYPENHIYIQALGQAYDHLKEYKEADEMWELYLQFSPTPIEGCPQVGLDYREQGKDAEALKAFERCHDIEENSDTLLFYANALERHGQVQKAVPLYEKAIIRAPDYPDVVIGLARVYAQTGRAAAARPLIDKMLPLQPNNSDALLAAGLVYSETGERAQALRYLRHAQEVAPEDNDIGVLIRRIARGGAAKTKVSPAPGETPDGASK